MPRIAAQAGPVSGGVDTHAEAQVAAVVDRVGRVLGTQAFPATAAGYRAALAWMKLHGELARVGVEGTGSYGAGLARYLAACGIEVAEVIRPNRQAAASAASPTPRMRWRRRWPPSAARRPGCPKAVTGQPSPSGR